MSKQINFQNIYYMNMYQIFIFDPVSILSIILTTVIGSCVAIFSYRFMGGDKNFFRFHFLLSLLILDGVFLSITDNFLLFFILWIFLNTILVILMIHKFEWVAAVESGKLALKNFCLGAIFLGLAFSLFYLETSANSFSELISCGKKSINLDIGLIFLILTAFVQSAIFPFHKWLISSSNAPTPVCAIMHAGIINGGGILLTKAAPVYLDRPDLLNIIFLFGLISCLIGSIWKLMQSNTKRMLASSTMGQMGFMIAQCGMGLFSSAIAHLLWHGFFKAYLFLSIGSSLEEDKNNKPNLNISVIAQSIVLGGICAFVFSHTLQRPFFSKDSSIILTITCLIFGAQIAVNFLKGKSIKQFFYLAIAMSVIGYIYAIVIHLVELFTSSAGLNYYVPINGFHLSCLLLWLLAFIFVLLIRSYPKFLQQFSQYQRFYVYMLNKSQPAPQTITSHRTNYHY